MALNEEQQTEAVFKSSRTDVDPVSGNEVPPGSLPEEVRDDLPAMLSEGEYVVPADVLRYYGMKFFEDLRSEAKMGLAGMEANGRIGGEPVMDEELPFSDEELVAMDMPETEAVAAAKGGLMGFQAGGLNFPEYIKQPNLSFLGGTGGGGLEYRTYVNDAGMTISIPFFDGEPMGMIPPGYTEGSEAPAEEKDTTGGVSDRGENLSDRTSTDREPSTPVDQMTANQVAETFSTTPDLSSKGAKLGLTAVSVLGGPLAGLLGKGAQALNANQREALETQADLLGLDLSTVDDPFNLSRENFKDDDSFNAAMQSVAGKDATYDPDTGSYTRADEDLAPTTSARPQARPGTDSSTSSSSNSGLSGFADSVAQAFGFDNAEDAFDGGGKGASANDNDNSNDADPDDGPQR